MEGWGGLGRAGEKWGEVGRGQIYFGSTVEDQIISRLIYSHTQNLMLFSNFMFLVFVRL